MGKNNTCNSKLSRLKAPGDAETLGAMVDDKGNIVTEPIDVAELFKNHWSRIFHNKPTKRDETNAWFTNAYPNGPPCKEPASE